MSIQRSLRGRHAARRAAARLARLMAERREGLGVGLPARMLRVAAAGRLSRKLVNQVGRGGGGRHERCLGGRPATYAAPLILYSRGLVPEKRRNAREKWDGSW